MVNPNLRRALKCRSKEAAKILCDSLKDLPNEANRFVDKPEVFYFKKAEARRKAIERQAKVDANKNNPVPDKMQLFNCDFRELNIKPGSVDLICTDIMWQSKYANDWKALARLAKVWMKPKGVFVTFFGQTNMALMLSTFRRELLPIHQFIYTFGQGGTTKNFERNIHETFRPIFAFTHKANSNHQFQGIQDCYVSNDMDKPWYSMQQPLNVVQDLISDLIKDDCEIVLDPQMGSGTTAIACRNLDIPFIGCEIKKEVYDLAIARITTTE